MKYEKEFSLIRNEIKRNFALYMSSHQEKCSDDYLESICTFYRIAEHYLKFTRVSSELTQI